MTKPCTYDPRTVPPDAPIGMFHCPLCGEMVLAGMGHPDYSLLEMELEDGDDCESEH